MDHVIVTITPPPPQTLKHSDIHQFKKKEERKCFFNDALNTFLFYGFMPSDIWRQTYGVRPFRERERKPSFRLAARDLLYASSHRQNNTYHGLCYTSRGAMAGTRNSSIPVSFNKPDNELTVHLSAWFPLGFGKIIQYRHGKE